MWPIIYELLSLLVSALPTRLRFRIWTYLHMRGSRIWDREGLAQRVEGGMYIKLTPQVRPSEGLATIFVRTHTTIPVPIVVNNVTVDGVTALVLSRLPGIPVLECRQDISAEQAHRLSSQLSTLLAQLRSLPPPSDGPVVSGFGQTPVYCERVAMDACARGPWMTIPEFHAYLIDRARLDIPAEKSDAVWTQIKLAHSRQHRICLTHNDLGPQNVLTDGDFNITGLIDWEDTAWVPEYWSTPRQRSTHFIATRKIGGARL